MVFFFLSLRYGFNFFFLSLNDKICKKFSLLNGGIGSRRVAFFTRWGKMAECRNLQLFFICGNFAIFERFFGPVARILCIFALKITSCCLGTLWADGIFSPNGGKDGRNVYRFRKRRWKMHSHIHT